MGHIGDWGAGSTPQRGNATYASLFAFTKEVLGYDLAKFFEEKSPYIKAEVQKILERLFDVKLERR